MFHMTNDSNYFRTREQLESDGAVVAGCEFATAAEVFVPLFDPKIAQQYNHRAATLGHSGHQFRKISKEEVPVELLAQADFTPQPLYWVPKIRVDEKLSAWPNKWLLGFKDVTGTTSTAIGVFTIIPRLGVSNKFPLVFAEADAGGHALLLSNLNSFVTEYILRLKFNGLSLNFFYVKQLPVLPPATYAEPCAWAGQPTTPLRDWLLPRVLELTYTAWDLEPFARDSGWTGPPFVWDEARRFQLRCELDAAYFHLYGLSRADAAYILDTFPIVRRKDEAAHGTYRTRETILALYDQLAEASRANGEWRMANGKGAPPRGFSSPLDPPPGTLRACHPPRSASPPTA